jgi:hypothetical protein
MQLATLGTRLDAVLRLDALSCAGMCPNVPECACMRFDALSALECHYLCWNARFKRAWKRLEALECT